MNSAIFFHIYSIKSYKSNSPFPKLLTQSSCSVVKLTDRKIRWIIREKSKDVLSTAEIARLQNVSESRVRQLLSDTERLVTYIF